VADHSIRIGIDSREAEAGAKRVAKVLGDVKSAADRVAAEPVKVDLDASPAERAAVRLSRTFRQVVTDAARLTGRGLAVDLDTAAAQRSAAGLSATLRGLREYAGRVGNVVLGVDARGADKALAALRAAAAAADSLSARDVRVGADDSELKAALGTLRALAEETVRASGRAVGVELNADAVRAGANEVMSTLGDLRRAVESGAGTIELRADTADLRTELGRVNALVAELRSGPGVEIPVAAVGVGKALRDIRAAVTEAERPMSRQAGAGPGASAARDETAVAVAEARRQSAAAERSQAERTAAAAAGAADRERIAQRETDAVVRETERQRDARGRFVTGSARQGAGGGGAPPAPKVDLDLSGAVRHVDNLRDAFGRLQDSAVSLNGVLAGIGAGALARDITQTGLAFQSLKTGLDVAAGSSTKGAQEMERLRAESQRLGLNTLSAGKEYTRFVAAIAGGNVDMAKARDTFFSVAQAMALLGKTPEEAGRAFTALAQIASRGAVQMDELGEQLGEQLPGTIQMAANAMGMSVQQLQKSMEAGTFTARQFFDTFGGAVAAKFPVVGQIDGAGAAFARLSNAFDDFKNRVSGAGFLDALGKGAQELARFLNGIEGQRLSEELGGMLKSAVEGLVAAFKVLAENIQAVTYAVGGLIAIKLSGWVLGIVGALANLGATLVNVGRAFASHPLLALGSLLATGAVALVQTNRNLQAVDATAKQHSRSLAEIEELHRKIATASGDEKAAAVDRAKAIVDSSRQVQAELEKELAQRRALIDEEAAIERRASPAGRSTFGPTQEGGRETLYNTGQVERQIREAEERRRAAENALSGTRSAPARDTLTNQQRSTRELERQTSEIEKQIAGQAKLAKGFDASKEAAVGIKRELEIISRTKPLEFRISEQTKAEIADLNARIDATREKIRADPGNTGLRVDLADMVGQVAAKERMPEGQMLAADVDRLRDSYRRLDAERDNLAAGPILQTLRSEIELTNRMADAHRKGTDAAQDEKDAQDARNRILEAGIDITGRAANAIHELVAAHNRAQELEAIELKVASQRREIDANAMREQVLATTQGPQRVAALAQFPAQVAAGNAPGPRPENLPFAMEANKALSDLRLEGQRQLEEEIIRTRAAQRQTKVGGVKSPEAAARAAREDAIGDIRAQRGYGPDAPLSETDQKIAEQRAEQGRQSYIQRQQNKTGRTPRDVFGERSRELGQSIDAQRELAAAYGDSGAAVEAATRKQEIMNKVHGFSEKLTKDQKAALEELVGTLYDVQKASRFEAAAFGMREAIIDADLLAAAHDKGVDAVNREKDAIEARRMALELGVSTDREAVQRLNDLIARRREAARDEGLAEEIAANRRYVGSLDEVRAAYDKVGEARVRALAETEARQTLLGQGADPNSERGQQFLAAAGDRSVGDWKRDAEDRVRLGQLEVEGTGRQMEAMRLFGEERVRRMAEIQKENELIAANGSATDELSQNQIRLAGDSAVASNQLSMMNDSLDQLANSIPNVTVAMRDAAFSGLMHFEDALVGIVTGTKSAREAFADMARSIAADLARMAIRMAIIQPLAMMFGGFGGAVAAPMASGFISQAAVGPIAWRHSGGVVGADPAPTGSLPATALPPLSAWTRLHAGGLAGNEVPTILEKGEAVLTPGQMKLLAPAGAGGGATTNNITVNVQAQPGASPTDSERQGRIIAQQIEQAMNEKLSKELRNGGILNPTGY
jgi:tape measure domain-containing protein